MQFAFIFVVPLDEFNDDVRTQFCPGSTYLETANSVVVTTEGELLADSLRVDDDYFVTIAREVTKKYFSAFVPVN